MQAAVLTAACAIPCVAAPSAVAQAVQPAPVADAALDALSQRLFPLLTALGRDQDGMTGLMHRSAVRDLMSARSERLTACQQEPGCVAQALIWQDPEIEALASALPTGLPAFDDGISAQARRELEGINVILRTYGLGQAPSYAAIDGAGTISPTERRTWLQAAAWMSQMPRLGSVQPLDMSQEFALALLDGSTRTDAVGFLPLNSGLNAAAFARARQTNWDDFRYSALIVTGIGPELDEMPLSPGGKYHLRLAAQQFARGEAAFIIVSGGRAHPFATPFAEAVEMRAALIDRYGIPADRIVIEPHARHTTTNMRNAARLLMAMEAPLTQNTLVVCNPVQSANIGSHAFVARNERELGYQPGSAGSRISPTALEWRPAAISARIDPRDPLDP
ncbi:YdcF family protein [Novosphingobium sp. M1R2S20]|uniref:YdcF family protein n=1 Tax=Novosphingobium rhizovicinum TaxID=3228928 RepID=A0ABV3REM0_9SPHN